jgi:hypothetical protein
MQQKVRKVLQVYLKPAANSTASRRMKEKGQFLLQDFKNLL